MKICVTIALICMALAIVSADVCPSWECKDIPQTGTGTKFVCVNRTSSTSYMNQICDQKEHYCEAPLNLPEGKSVNCTKVDIPAWKLKLAPGDSCTEAENCYTKKCGQDGVCVGNNQNETCSAHKDCNTGLFCKSGKCEMLADKNCTDDQFCRFGQLCHNKTCTRFGSLDDGVEVKAGQHYLCSSFYAHEYTSFLTKTYMCGKGPRYIGKEYKQKEVGTMCQYNVTDPKEKKTTTRSYPSTCGYNSGSESYCPLQRGDAMFLTAAIGFEQLWKLDYSKCHIETSISYCKHIESSITQAIKKEALKPYQQLMIETDPQSLGAYALYANNPECVKKSITIGFHRIADSAFSAISIFGSFFTVVAAYLLN